MEGTERQRGRSRWPLLLIALPAAVAIWSGWVGLGELCGFGPVKVLPGITGWTLNTAITLPIGAEAYAIYALHAYISPGTPKRARRFAFWSSIGAGLYGITGQVTFHLLTAAGRTRAPWPVVVFVSCMPVAVVMLAAVLTHLLNELDVRHKNRDISVAGTVPATVPVKPPLPGVREVQRTYNCKQPTEKKIRRALRARDAQWAQVIERGRGGGSVAGTAPAAQVPPAGDLPPSPAGALAPSNGSSRG